MLLIYLPAITSRSEYVFELIFKNELGIEHSTTTDIKIFEAYHEEKINYSSMRIGEELFIKASSLLFERTVGKKNITAEDKDGIPVLFANNDDDIGYDIFAATFYMVSRYEEYLPYIPDMHDRFKAADSLAYKNNFLQQPVVNIWIKHFKHILAEKFPTFQFRQTSFKAIVTYDIDVAYAFKGRTASRKTGATIKDILRLQFKNVARRIKSSTDVKDPWDIYDELHNTIVKNKLESIFFFLLGDRSRYDNNISYRHPLMKDIIRKVISFSDIGIHPSYKSSVIPSKIQVEKSRLRKISHIQITKSRQHYLRFNLPDTYNELLKAGITEDYSMGFADMSGFRAGICTPFYFYDLKNEKATNLLLYPISFMEGNFMKYMKKEPEESLIKIFELIDEVKNVEGTFISIWHNHTISETKMFKKWRTAHNRMIEKISQYG